MDLISAAKTGIFETVFTLLQNGCSCDIRDKDYATPLYWSACQGHTNVCEILIQAGSDVNSRVTWGSTPLHAAADRGHKNVIEVLIDSGADVNAQNKRGDTALHIAAYRGHSDVIMTLLTARADVSIRNEKGKTPQQEAMEGGHRTIAENIANFASGTHAISSGTRNAISPDEVIVRDNQDLRVYGGVGRRMSDFTLTYHQPETKLTDETEDPDYENADRRTSIPGPLPNFKNSSLDVPPPRPPIGRSVSFSGKHNQSSNTAIATQPNLQQSRTHSVPTIAVPYDIQKPLNDMNKSFKSSEYMNRLPAVNLQENSLSQPSSDVTDSSAYSSDYSYRTPSFQSTSGSEATEGSDYSVLFGSSRKVPELPPRSPVQPHRPNRLSVGSLNNYTDGNDPELAFVLKKQLVESYKQTEKLTAENESLNFKCSTLLSRLNETEQMCADKAKECESAKDLLEAKNKEVMDKDKLIQTLKSTPVISSDISKTGFKKLATRLNKELSEDTAAELQEILRSTLLAHAVIRKPSTETLDAPHREWVPGVDYVIVGRHQSEDFLENSESGLPRHISFLIKHLKTGRRLILKMLLRFHKRGDVQADDLCDSAEEVDILERLSESPNVVQVLHSYKSSTERFKKFIAIPASQPHNAQELCSRTTFIVTEQMMTLAKFIKSQVTETTSDVLSSFLLHCFYQLLALLCVFEELGIEHGNINETNIFINNDLQPVLGGFEMAAFNEMKTGLANEGMQQDYVNVEHLTRGPQMHRLPRNFPRRNNDLFALGKFFDNILLDDGSQVGDDVSSSFQFSSMTSLPPAVWQVLNGILTKFQNYSCRDCLHRIGFSLFGPRKGDIKNLYETRTLMQTGMFRLLATAPPETSINISGNGRLSIPDALLRNKFEMEAHFLCNITAKQLWDMYRMFEKDNLLQ